MDRDNLPDEIGHIWGINYYCSQENCDCSGPDAPVACLDGLFACYEDLTCEDCFLLSGALGRNLMPAGGFTCWDWAQESAYCKFPPGAAGNHGPPGYCSCTMMGDKEKCESRGGEFGEWGSNCKELNQPPICPNPHDECIDYPLPDGMEDCLTDCLGGVDAIVADHMQSCRDVYDEDRVELEKLLKKIPLDDPLRCILICEVEQMFCQCTKLGEKKRCLLANVCWVAYDQRNGTDGAGAVHADCLFKIGNNPCPIGRFPGSSYKGCNCNEILGQQRSDGVFDLHSGGGKFIKKMYKDFYSVMDAIENSSTPESLPLGDPDGKDSSTLRRLQSQHNSPLRSMNGNGGGGTDPGGINPGAGACLTYEHGGYCKCSPVDGKHYCGPCGTCSTCCYERYFYEGLSCEDLDCNHPDDDYLTNACMDVVIFSKSNMEEDCENKYNEGVERLTDPDTMSDDIDELEAARCECFCNSEIWYCDALRACYELYDERNGTHGAKGAFKECSEGIKYSTSNPSGCHQCWGREEFGEGTSESTYGGGKGSVDPIGGEDTKPVVDVCLMYDASGYCNCREGIGEQYCCCDYDPDPTVFGHSSPSCFYDCSVASFHPGMSCDMLDCEGPDGDASFNECMHFVDLASAIMVGGCEGKYDEDSGEIIPYGRNERCICLSDANAWYCYAIRACYEIYDENHGTNGAGEAYEDCKREQPWDPECGGIPPFGSGMGEPGTSESTYGGGKGSVDPIGGEDTKPVVDACLMYDASGYCNCMEGIEEQYCCCDYDPDNIGTGNCSPSCSVASFHSGMSCDMLDCEGPGDGGTPFDVCMIFINLAKSIMEDGCEGKYDEDSGEIIPNDRAERCECLSNSDAWFCYALRACYEIYDETHGTNGAGEAYEDCKAQATWNHPECRTGPTWGREEFGEGTSESTYGGGDEKSLKRSNKERQMFWEKYSDKK